MTDESELKMYQSLVAQEGQLVDDLRIITEIYGKVTSSHDYKEFAAKTNKLMQVVESRRKEVKAKINQWDMHFKTQQAYQEMMKHEQVVNELCEKYL